MVVSSSKFNLNPKDAMPNTIKSVCDELQDKLCQKQDFRLSAAVRDVKRAHERKSKRNRTVAVKNLLKLMITS